MKSEVAGMMLECGPSYPVSCGRPWGVRVYIQITLQRSTNGFFFWSFQHDRQRQQKA